MILGEPAGDGGALCEHWAMSAYGAGLVVAGFALLLGFALNVGVEEW
nr:hypothetical protein [Corynebacterium sp.]